MKTFTVDELRLTLAVMIAALFYLAIGYYIAKFTFFNHSYLRKMELENKILKEILKELEKELEELK
jgi:hypothetical protein